MNDTLSPSQLRILLEMIRYQHFHGLPPSYRDLAEACGYGSLNTVRQHMKTLARKGLIEPGNGLARVARSKYRFELRG